MSSHHLTEIVALGQRSYPVHIGDGLLQNLESLLPEGLKGKSCAIVTDSNVGPLFADTLSKIPKATLITIPAGEQSKRMEVVSDICDQMIAAGLDRTSYLIALGGGVVGDLAGFVAAIYFRGIPFIQIPTTIVSQVDSAVGGKTGVNAPSGKNLIGSFHQPLAVIADTVTLKTLPDRELNEGFAEVIKHAVIRDASLLDAIRPLDKSNLPPIIQRNVAIKAAIVSEDEQERSGTRALLNFGHTIGHGIENAAGYGQFLHGEAISLGMVAAARLSMEHAGLEKQDYQKILATIESFSLPTKLPESITTESIIDSMMNDKKFLAGQIRFVLCPKLGTAFVSSDITIDHIRNAIESLRN